MGKSLSEIAQELKRGKRIQLIYAFNGTGKTRLSRVFEQLINSDAETEDADAKIIYYNAFTEDLFSWDYNTEDLPKLKISPNYFTNWILVEQGQDQNIATLFKRFTNSTVSPKFDESYSEVTFPLFSGINTVEYIKISKGEENNFVWSVFYSLLIQVVEILNISDPSERGPNRFNNLEYVFIDDPVSSLDDNHLIELAVDLGQLIKSSKSELKFVITTHNPLFYNVLFNELGSDDKRYRYEKKHFAKHRLEKFADGTFLLHQQTSDSPFSYHLYLLSVLEEAISTNKIHKYHFNFLRNILEKTSTFLGYSKWGDLLPSTGDGLPNPYEIRVINISSHSKHSGEEITIIKDDDKRVLAYLVRQIKDMYRFKSNRTEAYNV